VLVNLFTIENLLALLALTSLEIVLGIDNIVFLSIVTGRLKSEQQPLARRIGLLAAMIMRILLLVVLFWLVGGAAAGVTEAANGHGDPEVGGWMRRIILFAGGVFLIGKATHEIHEHTEGDEHESRVKVPPTFLSVIIQIMLIDMVFSLDSVITAVGMANHLTVMIAAIVVAVFVMMLFAEPVSAFVSAHPTIRMLALSFLILIGVMLTAESMGLHIPKGYIYFAMAFSLGVEMLNMKAGHRRATA